MDSLLAIDHFLFLFINHLPHTAWTDAVAMFLSGIGQWGAVWFLIALYLFFREEKRDHWFFLPVATAAGLASLLSEFFIKFIVLRPRPAPDMGAIIVSAAGNYSFPSTHATLAFALAYVLSQEEPALRVWFYALATAIALSRVYLGVHYPSDVIAGAFFGLFIGFIAKKIPHRGRA